MSNMDIFTTVLDKILDAKTIVTWMDIFNSVIELDADNPEYLADKIMSYLSNNNPDILIQLY